MSIYLYLGFAKWPAALKKYRLDHIYILCDIMEMDVLLKTKLFQKHGQDNAISASQLRLMQLQTSSLRLKMLPLMYL